MNSKYFHWQSHILKRKKICVMIDDVLKLHKPVIDAGYYLVGG